MTGNIDIVYLAGAINGCTDSECKDWREYVKSELNDRYEFLDPMRRDFRGKEAISTNLIVEGDCQDINDCNIFLANANVPSWGTAMEIFYAFNQGKYVVLVCDKEQVSPWLRYHSHDICKTLDEAITLMKDMASLRQ